MEHKLKELDRMLNDLHDDVERAQLKLYSIWGAWKNEELRKAKEGNGEGLE